MNFCVTTMGVICWNSYGHQLFACLTDFAEDQPFRHSTLIIRILLSQNSQQVLFLVTCHPIAQNKIHYPNGKRNQRKFYAEKTKQYHETTEIHRMADKGVDTGIMELGSCLPSENGIVRLFDQIYAKCNENPCRQEKDWVGGNSFEYARIPKRKNAYII